MSPGLKIADFVELRKALPGLAGGSLEVTDTRNGSVLCFAWLHQGEQLLILANFSEREHAIPKWVVRQNMLDHKKVLFGELEFTENSTLWLPPYACVVFG